MSDEGGAGRREEPEGGAREKTGTGPEFGASLDKDASPDKDASLDKADRRLRRALDEAAPGEELRAIFTVPGAATPAGAGATPAQGTPAAEAPHSPPQPKDFADRVAYREAMIRHQGHHPRNRVPATREALERLGLTVQGGATSGLLMVTGSAAKLCRALALEAVQRASLDRKVRHAGPAEQPPAKPSSHEPPQPDGD